MKDLWGRFEKSWDSAGRGESLCHRCEHALRTEKIEPRVSPKEFPGLHESFYAPVDRSTFRPNKEDVSCKSCYGGWLEEKKNEGKICMRCGEWMSKSPVMMLEERDAETKKLWSRVGMCEKCFGELLEAHSVPVGTVVPSGTPLKHRAARRRIASHSKPVSIIVREIR